MEKLKTIIEQDDSFWGRVFDIFIQLLIIISIVAFSIETLPDLSDNTRHYLRVLDFGIIVVFSIEYLLRIVVADKKSKFIFSFYGIIDFVAIIPFYLIPGLDLRSLRMFRFFRLIRAFKLLRYMKAWNRFYRALQLAREEIILFFTLAMLMLFLSAVGIYYFEHPAQPDKFTSIFDSLWWAVATLTTVGYGDLYPITAGGRFFTFAILMIGLGVVAVPTGMLAAALAQARDEEENHET